MKHKSQIVRICIMLVIASILIIVDRNMPRPANLWKPVARMAVGTVVCIAVAKFTGLWK